MNMMDFEKDFAEFLKERFGEDWSYEWEGEEDGFSLTLQVWNMQPTYPMSVYRGEEE
jgi:hypothetical protein